MNLKLILLMCVLVTSLVNAVNCTEYDRGLNPDVASTATGLWNGELVTYEDTCSNVEHWPHILHEWWCDGENLQVEDYDCSMEYDICIKGENRCGSFKEACEKCAITQYCEKGICMNCPDGQIWFEGRCIDSTTCRETDDGIDYEHFGTAILNSQIETDRCEAPQTLWEYYCNKDDDGKDRIDIDAHYCGDNAYCDSGYCVACPENMRFSKHGCQFSDYDLDGIPDFEDNCLNTLPEDLIDLRRGTNTYGCSCEQGAEEVMIIGAKQGQLIDCTTELEEWISTFPWNNCPGTELPGHCCDSIYNADEEGVDCGGPCNPCEGPCTKIVDGGDLDLVFFPINYFPVAANNRVDISEWMNRADIEAERLLTTPPFDQGHISVWRIDLFGNQLRGMIDEIDEQGFIKEEQHEILSELFAYCPGSDMLSILYNKDGISFAWRWSHKNVIYNDNENVITHEIGHSFCGLEDEYIKVDTEPDILALNCDSNPNVCNLTSSGEIIKGTCRELKDEESCQNLKPGLVCICKWHPDHREHDDYTDLWYELIGTPGGDFLDAGCIPGCFDENAFRPEKDYMDSMMNSNYVIGPADGKGTWNQIGYQNCKELLKLYET